MAFEEPGEIDTVLVADGVGDGVDGLVGLPEEVLGAFDADGVDVFDGSQAVLVPEGPGEVFVALADLGEDAADGDSGFWFGHGVVEDFANAVRQFFLAVGGAIADGSIVEQANQQFEQDAAGGEAFVRMGV